MATSLHHSGPNPCHHCTRRKISAAELVAGFCPTDPTCRMCARCRRGRTAVTYPPCWTERYGLCEVHVEYGTFNKPCAAREPAAEEHCPCRQCLAGCAPGHCPATQSCQRSVDTDSVRARVALLVDDVADMDVFLNKLEDRPSLIEALTLDQLRALAWLAVRAQSERSTVLEYVDDHHPQRSA